MAYEWDDTEKGYRLICEATGERSEIVGTAESGVQGLEWYSNHPDAQVLYCNRQRERFVQTLQAQGETAGYITDMMESIRWDLLPNGDQVTDPRIEFPRRRLILMVTNKLTFAANGLDQAEISFPNLNQDLSVEVTPGGLVAVTPADPTLILTSDVPQTFVIRILDETVVAQPLTVRAL